MQDSEHSKPVEANVEAFLDLDAPTIATLIEYKEVDAHLLLSLSSLWSETFTSTVFRTVDVAGWEVLFSTSSKHTDLVDALIKCRGLEETRSLTKSLLSRASASKNAAMIPVFSKLLKYTITSSIPSKATKKPSFSVSDPPANIPQSCPNPDINAPSVNDSSFSALPNNSLSPIISNNPHTSASSRPTSLAGPTSPGDHHSRLHPSILSSRELAQAPATETSLEGDGPAEPSSPRFEPLSSPGLRPKTPPAQLHPKPFPMDLPGSVGHFPISPTPTAPKHKINQTTQLSPPTANPSDDIPPSAVDSSHPRRATKGRSPLQTSPTTLPAAAAASVEHPQELRGNADGEVQQVLDLLAETVPPAHQLLNDTEDGEDRDVEEPEINLDDEDPQDAQMATLSTSGNPWDPATNARMVEEWELEDLIHNHPAHTAPARTKWMYEDRKKALGMNDEEYQALIDQEYAEFTKIPVAARGHAGLIYHKKSKFDWEVRVCLGKIAYDYYQMDEPEDREYLRSALVEIEKRFPDLSPTHIFRRIDEQGTKVVQKWWMDIAKWVQTTAGKMRATLEALGGHIEMLAGKKKNMKYDPSKLLGFKRADVNYVLWGRAPINAAKCKRLIDKEMAKWKEENAEAIERDGRIVGQHHLGVETRVRKELFDRQSDSVKEYYTLLAKGGVVLTPEQQKEAAESLISHLVNTCSRSSTVANLHVLLFVSAVTTGNRIPVVMKEFGADPTKGPFLSDQELGARVKTEYTGYAARVWKGDPAQLDVLDKSLDEDPSPSGHAARVWKGDPAQLDVLDKSLDEDPSPSGQGQPNKGSANGASTKSAKTIKTSEAADSTKSKNKHPPVPGISENSQRLSKPSYTEWKPPGSVRTEKQRVQYMVTFLGSTYRNNFSGQMKWNPISVNNDLYVEPARRGQDAHGDPLPLMNPQAMPSSLFKLWWDFFDDCAKHNISENSRFLWKSETTRLVIPAIPAPDDPDVHAAGELAKSKVSRKRARGDTKGPRKSLKKKGKTKATSAADDDDDDGDIEADLASIQEEAERWGLPQEQEAEPWGLPEEQEAVHRSRRASQPAKTNPVSDHGESDTPDESSGTEGSNFEPDAKAPAKSHSHRVLARSNVKSSTGPGSQVQSGSARVQGRRILSEEPMDLDPPPNTTSTSASRIATISEPEPLEAIAVSSPSPARVSLPSLEPSQSRALVQSSDAQPHQLRPTTVPALTPTMSVTLPASSIAVGFDPQPLVAIAASSPSPSSVLPTSEHPSSSRTLAPTSEAEPRQSRPTTTSEAEPRESRPTTTSEAEPRESRPTTVPPMTPKKSVTPPKISPRHPRTDLCASPVINQPYSEIRLGHPLLPPEELTSSGSSAWLQLRKALSLWGSKISSLNISDCQIFLSSSARKPDVTPPPILTSAISISQLFVSFQKPDPHTPECPIVQVSPTCGLDNVSSYHHLRQVVESVLDVQDPLPTAKSIEANIPLEPEAVKVFFGIMEKALETFIESLTSDQKTLRYAEVEYFMTIRLALFVRSTTFMADDGMWDEASRRVTSLLDRLVIVLGAVAVLRYMEVYVSRAAERWYTEEGPKQTPLSMMWFYVWQLMKIGVSGLASALVEGRSDVLNYRGLGSVIPATLKSVFDHALAQPSWWSAPGNGIPEPFVIGLKQFIPSLTLFERLQNVEWSRLSFIDRVVILLTIFIAAIQLSAEPVDSPRLKGAGQRSEESVIEGLEACCSFLIRNIEGTAGKEDGPKFAKQETERELQR